MCGIAGLLSLNGRAADRGVAESMVATIAHRGPDAQGVVVRGPVALAHARLSIVDLAGGGQPMTTGAERCWVTFNGEIFNHVELREELAALGHAFRTRSDTEVLLASYLEWGPECVRRFVGQWAFAIWDEREKLLFLSRDPMGIRPLYHARAGQTFVFGSEIKALFAHPEVPRAIDRVGLDQILTTWSPIPPRTCFEGIFELPPGTNLLVERGELREVPYFDLDYSHIDETDLATQAEELRARLIEATRLRLFRSDVPVGAYLSGGLDSTAVVGIVRRFTDQKLDTFSVAFADPEFDESVHQREVVDHFQVTHHEVRVDGDAVCRSFPDVVRHAEQTLVRTAPAPLFALSKLVRDHGYKVVLTGEGADELFGGYDIFKEAKVRRFWARQPDSKLRPLLLHQLYPYLPRLKAQSTAYLSAFFHARPEDVSSPFFAHLPRWELTAKTKIFYNAETRSALAGHDPVEAMRARLPANMDRFGPFEQGQYIEARFLLPGYILSAQGDRMLMGHSVEGRFPFLDPKVVELSQRIRATHKMRALDEKAIVKRALVDVIPPSIARRKKQPYRAPDASSFFDAERGVARASWVDSLLEANSVAETGIFEPKAVKLLADKARRGRALGARDNMALVAVLSTELLQRQLVERKQINGND